LKILEVLGINLFRNLRLIISIYYFLTTIGFLFILYYFLVTKSTTNLLILTIVLILLIIISSFFISKLSIDPLTKHMNNLQNLSTETLHELNLPISTIITNLHLLKKNLATQKDLKRISRIESACDMLQQRYNELDYMIKLQSSKVIKETFFLDELINNRVTFLKPLYPHIEFNLQVEITQITNDKIGLSKVIDNLIDNGVKYSQDIHKINIYLQDDILSIKDFGCGMDEVEIINIFDNYYQSNEDIQGFGIGLSMVKRFCTENKVLLTINSKLDSGTTINLKF